MPNVGRNDLCPCGSGKKYKHCCMSRDRAVQSQHTEARRSYETLFDQLFLFSQGPAFEVDLLFAFNLFWNGSYHMNAVRAIDRRDLLRFFDWYVLDYPTWQSKRTILAEFLAQVGSKLTEAERQILGDWQQSVMSLFRVQEAKPAAFLVLRDLIIGGDYQVDEMLWSRMAVADDLLVGHVLPVPGGARLSPSPTLLPPSMQDDLMQYINAAWQGYQEAHYQATKRDFLRESGHLFNHALLNKASLTEAKLARGGKYYDAGPALLALQKARAEEEEQVRKRLEQRLEKIDEEGRDDEEGQPNVEFTKSGLIIPGSEPVSKPRMEDKGKTFAGGKLLLP